MSLQKSRARRSGKLVADAQVQFNGCCHGWFSRSSRRHRFFVTSCGAAQVGAVPPPVFGGWQRAGHGSQYQKQLQLRTEGGDPPRRKLGLPAAVLSTLTVGLIGVPQPRIHKGRGLQFTQAYRRPSYPTEQPRTITRPILTDTREGRLGRSRKRHHKTDTSASSDHPSQN